MYLLMCSGCLNKLWGCYGVLGSYKGYARLCSCKGIMSVLKIFCACYGVPGGCKGVAKPMLGSCYRVFSVLTGELIGGC